MKAVFRATLLVVAVLLAGCAKDNTTSDAAVLAAISSALTYQYHECVPLGWAPVPTAGSFVPGYDTTELTYEEFLDAAWRGSIATRDLRSPTAATLARVLDRLAAAGLLTRALHGGRIQYGLTHESMKYFYSSELYGNNHGSLPYLCYSTIVPTRVLWMKKISAPPRWRKVRNQRWYRLSFAWKASAPEPWAADRVIRSHSVLLAPLRSPTAARVHYWRGSWDLINIYDRGWMLPALADPPAWIPKSG